MAKHIKKNEAMQLRYQRLFECAQDGILILNYPDGEIIDVNPFLCKLIQYDKIFFIGKKLWEIGFIADKSRALEMFKNLIDEGYIRYENIDLKTSSGELMSVEFICNTYTAGDETVIQCNVRDIRDRVKYTQLAVEFSAVKVKNLNSIINCLSAIIESRDPYTAGHQYRVADFASQIARHLKLPESQVIGIHLAGILHDIGKFKIPLELLVKPQELSPEEFNLVKLHPKVGADILKLLNLEQDISRIVLQHHERLDGSGYPYGLKKNQICIEAKILAVADVIESISSFRPYRPALGIQEALKEVMKNKGKLYDVNVVNACLDLIIRQDYTFPSPKVTEKISQYLDN